MSQDPVKQIFRVWLVRHLDTAKLNTGVGFDDVYVYTYTSHIATCQCLVERQIPDNTSTKTGSDSY